MAANSSPCDFIPIFPALFFAARTVNFLCACAAQNVLLSALLFWLPLSSQNDTQPLPCALTENLLN
jgi:hypothetical protein